jgi:hypothetical protein
MVAGTHGNGRLDVGARIIGGIAGVLAAALAFRIVPGGQSPFTPLGTVAPPYLSAVAGAAISRFFR